MNRRGYLFIAFLLILSGFIWLRDTAWMSSADDTLSILAALPLFVWMGAPWTFKEIESPFSLKNGVIGAIFLLSGIALNLTLLLTIGWVYLFWTWFSKKLITPTTQALKKLLVIPLMAFPWITLDLTQLGWWFRLSGAFVTAGFFSLFGNHVEQEGTNILINKLPISVEVACAGINTLQSMLIAGTAIAYLFLGNTNRFWWNLPLLFLIAWIANTLRIILLSFVALQFGTEFAMGSYHTIGGWLVILLMFGVCWFIFSLQEPKKRVADE